MKCGACGQEGFTNIGEVNRHKRVECTGRALTDEQIKEAVAAVVMEERAKDVRDLRSIIPWDKCDPTLKVLAKNTPIPMVVLGRIVDEGIEVMEVTVQRRGR